LEGALARRRSRLRLGSDRRPRGALLASALGFGPTPSRCAARRQELIRALDRGP